MAVKATTSTRAPRGAKTLAQAFFTAADSIPDAQRAGVVKAALSVIRGQLKDVKDKAKAAKIKVKEKAAKASAKAPKAPKAAAAPKPIVAASKPAKAKVAKKPVGRKPKIQAPAPEESAEAAAE
jgi:hypothetical protein